MWCEICAICNFVLWLNNHENINLMSWWFQNLNLRHVFFFCFLFFKRSFVLLVFWLMPHWILLQLPRKWLEVMTDMAIICNLYAKLWVKFIFAQVGMALIFVFLCFCCVLAQSASLHSLPVIIRVHFRAVKRTANSYFYVPILKHGILHE